MSEMVEVFGAIKDHKSDFARNTERPARSANAYFRRRIHPSCCLSRFAASTNTAIRAPRLPTTNGAKHERED